MPNNGNNFRHALAEYIRGWGEGLAVEESCKQKSIAEVKKVPQNLHS